MVYQWMFVAALLAVVLWWTRRLSQDIVRAIRRGARSDALTSLYPVFSEESVVDAYWRAATTSDDLRRVQNVLMEDSAFRESTKQHAIPDDISRRMLEVSRLLVTSEERWFRHSAMMDANLSVITGKATRDEALVTANERLRFTNDTFSIDAEKARDEWKLRLETPGAPAENTSPRPYGNPWFEEASGRHHGNRDD